VGAGVLLGLGGRVVNVEVCGEVPVYVDLKLVFSDAVAFLRDYFVSLRVAPVKYCQTDAFK
jgi:hypothetical protein